MDEAKGGREGRSRRNACLSSPHLPPPPSLASAHLSPHEGPRGTETHTPDQAPDLTTLLSVSLCCLLHSQDCRKRFFHSLAPDLKKGRWSKEEDRLLLEGLEKLGPVWFQVSTPSQNQAYHS